MNLRERKMLQIFRKRGNGGEFKHTSILLKVGRRGVTENAAFPLYTV